MAAAFRFIGARLDAVAIVRASALQPDALEKTPLHCWREIWLALPLAASGGSLQDQIVNLN